MFSLTPRTLNIMMIFVIISSAFVPWFSWQRDTISAESGTIYTTTNLIFPGPEANWVQCGASCFYFLEISQRDEYTVSVISWIARIFVIMGLMISTQAFIRKRTFITILSIVLISVYLLFSWSSASVKDLGDVFTIEYSEDLESWKISEFHWSGLLLLITGFFGYFTVTLPEGKRRATAVRSIIALLSMIYLWIPLHDHFKTSLFGFITAFNSSQPLSDSQIVFVSNRNGNQDIYLMKGDGSDLYNLTQNSSNELMPVWSPDGTHILFVSDRDSNLEIYRMKADGSELINLTSSSSDDYSPAYSPDGHQIAFISNRSGLPEIYLMNTDGSQQLQLTKNENDEVNLRWLREKGKIIAFEEITGNFDHEKEKVVYFIDKTGYHISYTYHFVGGDYSECPSWSTNGVSVIFTSSRTGNYEIYGLGESGSVNLSGNLSDDVCPSVSPNRNSIAFTSNRDGNQEIYLMNIDGSVQTRITYDASSDFNPVWRP